MYFSIVQNYTYRFEGKLSVIIISYTARRTRAAFWKLKAGNLNDEAYDWHVSMSLSLKVGGRKLLMN